MILDEHAKAATAFKKGDKITFTTLIPERDKYKEWALGVFGRNPAKIVLLNPDAGEKALKPYNQTVFTDGELPRAQLKRVLKK